MTLVNTRYKAPEPKEPVVSLYLSSQPVQIDLSKVMAACGTKDRPFAVRDFASETLLRNFLKKQSDGIYLFNSIAGPTPWKGSCAGNQGTLGFLEKGKFVLFNAKSSQAQNVMKSKYKGNANCRCGSANPSWDPVVADVKKGSVNFPTTPIPGATVFHCAGDGYNTKRPVVCQKM